MPAPAGPRHCGQLEVWPLAPPIAIARMIAMRRERIQDRFESWVGAFMVFWF